MKRNKSNPLNSSFIVFCLSLLLVGSEAYKGQERPLQIVMAESVAGTDGLYEKKADDKEANLFDEELQRSPRQFDPSAASSNNFVPNRNGKTVTGKLSARDLVSDIHCLRTSNVETFTAFLRVPDGFATVPVLENTKAAAADGEGHAGDPTMCLITRTNIDKVMALDLSQMEQCGVRQCQPSSTDGGADSESESEVTSSSSWMCVTVRFPMLPGLKMPEDEVIDIKCKPQDHAVAGSNVINFQENEVEQRSPTIYVGGGQDFLSEIGLFRRLPGTELFASRVKSGSSIELGENVQLRSIVREGDGWNYAMLTDVMVHRVRDGKAMMGPRDTAELVFSNGCRNPAYRALAVSNPWRDSGNALINNFDFRVFMFQEMDNGDSIMITAKVVACVESIDCAPVRCGSDQDEGYGKRRRRRRSVYSNSSQPLNKVGKTKGWEENLELKIRMPPDLLPLNGHGVAAASEWSPYDVTGTRQQKSVPLTESECKIYLIITLSVALTFCVLSAVIVMVACFKRYQENKAGERKRKQREAQEQLARTNHGGGSDAASSNLKPGGQPMDKLPCANGYYPAVIPAHFEGGQMPAAQPNRVATNNYAQTQRPVTVRSVKRRDKAKTEEKRAAGNGAAAAAAAAAAMGNNSISKASQLNHAQQQQPPQFNSLGHLRQLNGGSCSNDREEAAVMV